MLFFLPFVKIIRAIRISFSIICFLVSLLLLLFFVKMISTALYRFVLQEILPVVMFLLFVAVVVEVVDDATNLRNVNLVPACRQKKCTVISRNLEKHEETQKPPIKQIVIFSSRKIICCTIINSVDIKSQQSELKKSAAASYRVINTIFSKDFYM